MCLIGESFEEDGHIVNGAVVSVRPRGDKIGIWLGNAKMQVDNNDNNDETDDNDEKESEENGDVRARAAPSLGSSELFYSIPAT